MSTPTAEFGEASSGDSDDLHALLARARSIVASAIEDLIRTESDDVTDYVVAPRTVAAPATEGLLRAANALMAAADASTGECHMATPWAPLRPVIMADGTFKWCCSHNPQHCAI